MKTSRYQKKGRQVLIDQMLDKAVQDYITSMRVVRDVVYNIIVLAAAEGVIAAQNWALLIQHSRALKIMG